MAISKTNLKGPWYKNREHWYTVAAKYMQAYLHLPRAAKQHAEFEMFAELCKIRLVFESNLIEEAGKSFDDTKKLVQEYFPEIPSNYNLFKRVFCRKGKAKIGENLSKQVRQMAEAIEKFEGRNLQPRFRLGGHAEREIQEVLQHYLAILTAEKDTWEFLVKKHQLKKANALRVKHPNPVELQSEWEKISPNEQMPTTHKSLFSERKIKDVHKVLADGLLPDDAKVDAGEYRRDARSVGYDIAFPAHELVPECMKKFVNDSNNLIDEAIPGKTNPFEVAARISYDFVRIHPFPDFNGRMSRIILMMVLISFSVPFAFTLRGSKKHKHRYGYSLRRANRGEIQPYAALIAMRLAETFQEIDENIMLAGLEPLIPTAN